MECKRSASIKAKMMSILYTISREHMVEVLAQYQGVEAQLWKIAADRIGRVKRMRKRYHEGGSIRVEHLEVDDREDNKTDFFKSMHSAFDEAEKIENLGKV